MSARPGDNTSNSFTLPSHVDRNITTEDSAEEIVEYFAKISQEFTPIEEDTLPESLIEKLEDIHCEHPEIVEHDIFENMKKNKEDRLYPWGYTKGGPQRVPPRAGNAYHSHPKGSSGQPHLAIHVEERVPPTNPEDSQSSVRRRPEGNRTNFLDQ